MLVIAAPELTAGAATDLANIGSAVSAAHMVAATPTVAVIPAVADEISASIAHLFSRHAQDYQALAGQAAAFHEQFAQQLVASGHSYAGAEAANAALLGPAATMAASPTVSNPILVLLNDVVNGLFNLSLRFASLFLPANVGPLEIAVLSALSIPLFVSLGLLLAPPFLLLSIAILLLGG
jgi:hypothetical protein